MNALSELKTVSQWPNHLKEPGTVFNHLDRVDIRTLNGTLENLTAQYMISIEHDGNHRATLQGVYLGKHYMTRTYVKSWITDDVVHRIDADATKSLRLLFDAERAAS